MLASQFVRPCLHHALIVATMFLVAWMFADGGVTAESLTVVRIPTGTPESAQKLSRDLERIGLGHRFDHIRTQRAIEMVIDPVELRRLQRASMSPLHLQDFPDPADWQVVRNMSGHEYGTARPFQSPHHNGQQLPIQKRRYHTPEEIEHLMRTLSQHHPDLVSMQRIGTSVRRAPIWALSISGTSDETARRRQRMTRSQSVRDAIQKPAVAIFGSLHGDDRVGAELCLWTAEYLCRAYETVSALRQLLDSLQVFLIPVPNPDAFRLGQRYTDRGIDLDRAFHDRMDATGNPLVTEPEVEALSEWYMYHNILASAMFRGGGGAPSSHGLVVRYPYNSAPPLLEFPRPERTKDDRGLRYLARNYAAHHPVMRQRDPNGFATEPGTVNGAEWYARYGTLQDWVYDHTGALHLDLIISPFLKPLPQHLPSYWGENHDAIIYMLIELSRWGLRGQVVSARTEHGIPGAVVTVIDLTDRGRHLKPVAVGYDEGEPEANLGQFAKFLISGHYAVIASAPGYHTSPELTFHLNHRQSLYELRIELQPHSGS